MNFVFTAIPFGFGPVSALSSVVSMLPFNLQAKSTIILPHNLSGIVSYIKIASFLTATGSTNAYLNNLGKETILINFGELKILQNFNLKCKQVFIDCVGWLTPKLLKLQNEKLFWGNLIYLVEYFPPTSEFSIPNFAKLVQPSLSPCYKKFNNSSEILISIGGGYVPKRISQNNIIYKLANSIFDKISKKLPYSTVHLCGGSNLTNCNNIRYLKLLTHEDHIKLIAKSKVVITVPGLYTVFEALKMKKPIVLLPPTNYTQVVQFNWYVENGFVPSNMNWTDMLGLHWDGYEICSEEDEFKYINLLREKISQNIGFQQEVIDKIVKFISDLNSNKNKKFLYQQKNISEVIISKFCNKNLPAISKILLELCYE